MFFDGASEYLGNLGKAGDDIGDAINQADDIELTETGLGEIPVEQPIPVPSPIQIVEPPKFNSMEEISEYLRNDFASGTISSSNTIQISDSINQYITEQINKETKAEQMTSQLMTKLIKSAATKTVPAHEGYGPHFCRMAEGPVRH